MLHNNQQIFEFQAQEVEQNILIQAKICYKADTLWRSPNANKCGRKKTLALYSKLYRANYTIYNYSMLYYRNGEEIFVPFLLEKKIARVYIFKAGKEI